MQHDLAASLDEMLATASLSALEERPVRTVCCQPWTPPDLSYSGCPFLSVATDDGSGQSRHYIVKRISTAWDVLMRATADDAGREQLIWQHGLLDRLPPAVAHPVVAAAVDGDGWAILMQDVSSVLLPTGDADRLSVPDLEHLLGPMAALHAHFWEDSALLDPALGLCSAWSRYTSLGPATGRREPGPTYRAARGPERIPAIIREGWPLLEALLPSEVASAVRGLLEDPQPLCAALARYPWTLVHGDMKAANLGLERGQPARLVLLDWHFVGPTAPAVDLAWFVQRCAHHLPVTKEAAIACYRRRLAWCLGERFDERWWQPQLDLSLLGQFLLGGAGMLYRAAHGESHTVRTYWQAELAWWSERVRAGVRWL